MDLTPSNIVAYLVERGVIPPAVARAVVVNPSIRRNRNFKILRPNHPGYFVKQAKEEDAAKTVRREALCYWRAHDDLHLAPLAKLLPRFVDYDEENNVLVVELVGESETLYEHFLRDRSFTPEIGALLADGLATYQSELGRRLRGEVDDETFPGTLPWLFTAVDEPEWFRGWFGDAGAELLAWLRGHEDFVAAIRRVAGRWRRDTLVHGDLKWDNCLLVREPGGRHSLKIVDWELADVGDARWDLGGVIQAFLVSWSSWAAYGVALDAVQSAIQGFWRRYVEVRAIPRDQIAPLLEQCIECAALRTAQSALEAVYGSTEVHPSATEIADLALRMVSSPSGAIVEQLGLSEVDLWAPPSRRQAAGSYAAAR
ncbi:MAG: phosphotransferase [Nannocystaceae bacterium]